MDRLIKSLERDRRERRKDLILEARKTVNLLGIGANIYAVDKLYAILDELDKLP